MEVSTTEQAPNAPETDDADAPADAVEPLAEEEKTSEEQAEGEDIPGFDVVLDKAKEAKDAETEAAATETVDAPATHPDGVDKSTDDHL